MTNLDHYFGAILFVACAGAIVIGCLIVARRACDEDEQPTDINVYPGLTTTEIVDLTMWELEFSEPS